MVRRRCVVSANMSSRAQRGICTLLVLSLAGCSWFTDFKEQPKIDPWDTPDTNTAPRGNPQGSVPMNGSVAPEFAYARNFAGLGQLAALVNPVPATQESIDREDSVLRHRRGLAGRAGHAVARGTVDL